MKQSVLTGILIAVAVAMIGLFIFTAVKLAALLLLVVIALVITAGIDPVVQRMQRLSFWGWHMPRALATLLILSAALVVFLGILTFFVVYGVNQGVAFAKDVWPTTSDSLTKLLGDLHVKYPKIVPESGVIVKRLSEQSGQIAGYLWSTTRAVFGIIGGIFSIITVIILTVFFTISKDGILYTLLQFVPPRYHARVSIIGHEAAERMGGWLRGQVMLAIIIMILTTVGMLFFPHVRKYCAMIGIIGGIGEMIPMLGPYVAFFPAVIIAWVNHASAAEMGILFIFFAALSQAENYLLAPKVMERQVKLSPVSTVFSLLAGGALLGIVGALLAIPLAAALRVVLLEAVFPAIQGKTRREIEEHCPGVHPSQRTTPVTAPPPLPLSDTPSPTAEVDVVPVKQPIAEAATTPVEKETVAVAAAPPATSSAAPEQSERRKKRRRTTGAAS